MSMTCASARAPTLPLMFRHHTRTRVQVQVTRPRLGSVLSFGHADLRVSVNGDDVYVGRSTDGVEVMSEIQRAHRYALSFHPSDDVLQSAWMDLRRDQYDTLSDFVSRTDDGRYDLVTNNCVDFVDQALSTAGVGVNVRDLFDERQMRAFGVHPVMILKIVGPKRWWAMPRMMSRMMSRTMSRVMSRVISRVIPRM